MARRPQQRTEDDEREGGDSATERFGVSMADIVPLKRGEKFTPRDPYTKKE